MCAPTGSPGADARAFLAVARAAGASWSYGTLGMGTIAKTPKVHDTLFHDGYETVGLPAEGLAARIKADTALLGRIITSRGIRAS